MASKTLTTPIYWQSMIFISWTYFILKNRAYENHVCVSLIFVLSQILILFSSFIHVFRKAAKKNFSGSVIKALTPSPSSLMEVGKKVLKKFHQWYAPPPLHGIAASLISFSFCIISLFFYSVFFISISVSLSVLISISLSCQPSFPLSMSIRVSQNAPFPWNISWPVAKERFCDVGFENVFLFIPERAIEKTFFQIFIIFSGIPYWLRFMKKNLRMRTMFFFGFVYWALLARNRK